MQIAWFYLLERAARRCSHNRPSNEDNRAIDQFHGVSLNCFVAMIAAKRFQGGTIGMQRVKQSGAAGFAGAAQRPRGGDDDATIAQNRFQFEGRTSEGDGRKV